MMIRATLNTAVCSLSLCFGMMGMVYADAHHEATAQFKTQTIQPNLYLLQGKGGNVAVLAGEQGLVVVDDDYSEMSPALTEALKPLGGQQQIRYVINTHWHGDHTQGNYVLGQYAPIVAHENVRQRLLTKQEIKLFNMVSEPYPENALPSVTYQQQMNLYVNNQQLQLIHLPNGHTDGDSVVYFKDGNVMHLGDHFFNGFFPFVDVEHGGNVLNMAANLRQLLTMIDDNTVLIPGHGPLGNKADLVAFIEMLEGTSAEVKAMKAQGLTLKQMQKKGLSEQWKSWTDGFLNTATWISLIDASL